MLRSQAAPTGPSPLLPILVPSSFLPSLTASRQCCYCSSLLAYRRDTGMLPACPCPQKNRDWRAWPWHQKEVAGAGPPLSMQSHVLEVQPLRRGMLGTGLAG